MTDKELYIVQRDKESDLYTALQREALEMVQGLSGKVWTDYNAHDPGITILDVLNYALTELAYKLDFPLEDYLTGEREGFCPEAFGFFPPHKVFPVAPVTVQDYRQLLLMHIPELENVWIDVNRSTGKYFIHLEVFDFLSGIVPEEISKRVRELYQANRNLCESLEEVDFVKLEEVTLQAELHLQPGSDPTAVLVQVFRQAGSYLAQYVGYEMPEEREVRGISPDEWLDGPNDTGMRMVAVSEGKVRTESELYRGLCRIEGVNSVYSCYVRDREGKVVNRFEKPYALAVPQSLYELERSLQVKIDGIPVHIRFEGFLSELNTAHFSSRNYMKVHAGEKFSASCPAGKYRPLFSHAPVAGDFPDCYGVNERGVSGFATEERKAQAKQLKGYLSLFDFVFCRGLTELAGLREWMKLEDCRETGLFSTEMLGRLQAEGFLDGGMPEGLSVRRVLKGKERLLDMLDALYGEESRPAWLNEYNCYGDTPEDRLRQRIRFLQRVPEWGRDRFKACDVTGRQGLSNVAGVKAYISALLDWQCDESKAVGNVFPAYNLNLISDEEYDTALHRMSKSDLIQERMLRPGNLEPVGELAGEYGEKEYEEMRFALPFFHNNLLYESLFQGGVTLENYRIVAAGEADFLLAFRNQKKNVWLSLGRSVNKGHLERMANILRHFLLKLNRESEAMYVVEHIFFRERGCFALSVLVPGWSARTASPRFREVFRKLVLGRLPAHIEAGFYWLTVDELQQFEMNWRKWRVSMVRGNAEMAAEAMEGIEGIEEQIKGLKGPGLPDEKEEEI